MVSSVSNTSSSTASSTTALTSAEAQTDRFLKLLVAQLNNQDPMNPMDNAQMTSQMAQINTVSGIQQLNETMKSMSTQFNALQGSAMLGRGVMLKSNTLTIKNGVAAGAVNLETKADKVTIQIYTPGGQQIDKLELGAQDAGLAGFQWDASKYKGTGSPTFKVTATLNGKTVGNTALAYDTVAAVGFNNGTMTVELAGRKAVPYSDIQSIL